LSAVFDRLIKMHISLRLGYGSSLGALWELSGSSLGALWELVAVAGIFRTGAQKNISNKGALLANISIGGDKVRQYFKVRK
jgi:hypothetical protein